MIAQFLQATSCVKLCSAARIRFASVQVRDAWPPSSPDALLQLELLPEQQGALVTQLLKLLRHGRTMAGDNACADRCEEAS